MGCSYLSEVGRAKNVRAWPKGDAGVARLLGAPIVTCEARDAPAGAAYLRLSQDLLQRAVTVDRELYPCLAQRLGPISSGGSPFLTRPNGGRGPLGEPASARAFWLTGFRNTRLPVADRKVFLRRVYLALGETCVPSISNGG